MTLSIEEINRQLEEYPHDLTAWEKWLSYTRRHNLPQDKYIDYLKNLGIVTEIDKYFWKIVSKSMSMLGGLSNYDLKLISIWLNSKYNRLSELSHFRSPSLNFLTIEGPHSIVIDYIPPTLISLHLVDFKSLIFEDSVDLSQLESLDIGIDGLVSNFDMISTAKNLSGLFIGKKSNIDGTLQLSDFPKLRTLQLFNNTILHSIGNSSSLVGLNYAHSPNTLNILMDRVSEGWYPNLEHPIKGKNKQ